MRIPIAAVAALFVLAGCLEEPKALDLKPGPAADAAQALIRLGDQVAFGTEGLLFNGTGPVKIPFKLDLPADYWTTHTGSLEVSVRWHFASGARYTASLRDANGKTVADARYGSYASVMLIDKLAAGDYIIDVQSNQYSSGKGPFEGVVQLESREIAAAPRELLPNLAALSPDQLQVQWLVESATNMPSLPARACWPTETAEKQHLRCLRVSSAVGNAGEGVLQIHMSQAEGAKAAAGLGRYTQRIFKTDGTYREEPVGLGQFHPTHAHFHYNGLAQFTVYKYDMDKDLRGDKVSQSRKSGFCLIDMGLIRLGTPGTTHSGYVEDACLIPDQRGGWIVGLSPSWYDLYGAFLDDQSVNIYGVPDGIYELVYTVNAEKTIKESSLEDNEASTVFKLTGDQVQVLKRIEDGKHLPPVSRG